MERIKMDSVYGGGRRSGWNGGLPHCARTSVWDEKVEEKKEPWSCYLRNEDETEGASGAEDDKNRYYDVGNVLLVLQDERNRSTNHAHDHHVVDTHTC